MNIELDEVVVQDVSDESLEQAAGGAQGGGNSSHCYICRVPFVNLGRVVPLTGIPGVSSCCAGNLQPWSLI